MHCLRNANAEQAQVLFSALDSAMRDYAAYLEGDKYDVVFNVTQTVLQLKTPLSPLPTPTAMRAFTAEQPPRLMQVFQPIPFPTAGTTALRAE